GLLFAPYCPHSWLYVQWPVRKALQFIGRLCHARSPPFWFLAFLVSRLPFAGAGEGYSPSFSMTRSLAERLRRFSSSSAAVASMGLRVMSFPFALPPHTQTGYSGGQVQAVAHWRNL